MICKLVSTAFYFLENSFDSVLISMDDVLKLEVVVVERGLEPRCSVNEKQSIGDCMFLTEFAEKPLGESGCTRRWSRK